LFGSVARAEKLTTRSDVDFLVAMEKNRSLMDHAGAPWLTLKI